MNESILKTIDLTMQFKDKKAVDNLNLNVYEGDVYGFLGHNGAGKTTTIKMILGLLKPSSGNALINGVNAFTDLEKALSYVGAVVENPVFYNNLSGYKNLKLYANLYGNISNERINEVLELVEMKNAANKKVKNYSLGMKQRLGIARAFLNNPKIIILDEPTNGLDPKGIRDIRNLVLKLAKEYNTTFLVSSHILSEIEQMCNKVGIIHNGKLIKEGKVNELLTNAKSLEDYFIDITENYGEGIVYA